MTDAIELHSGAYVDRYNRKTLTRVRRLAARMQIKSSDDIIDFGCGNGMLLQAIGTRTGRYVGVDFSQEFIDSATAWAIRSALNNYEFHCSLIADYCKANPSSCDIAATLDLSEHVTDADAIEIFSSIRRAMRREAKLYVHTPNAEFLIEQLKAAGILRQFPEHIAVRTGSEIRAILETAGFAPEKIRVDLIPHYNVLRIVDPLKHLPLAGPHFGARLWIEAQA